MDVALDEKTHTRIRALAAARRRSAHSIMKEAIGQYVDRAETIEQHNRKVDAARDEYLEAGRSVSHEAVDAWLSTWGTDREGPCPEPER